LQAN
jgi:hypothetical protein